MKREMDGGQLGLSQETVAYLAPFMSPPAFSGHQPPSPLSITLPGVLAAP